MAEQKMDSKNRKLKLLIMLPMLHQGGFERVAVTTARLLQDDFEVALCIFNDQKIHYDVTGLRIINLDVPSAKNKMHKVINALKRAVRARRVRRDFDLCYSFGSTANLVNYLSSRWDVHCMAITGMRCGTDLEDPALQNIVRGSRRVISCSKELDLLLQQKTHRTSGTHYIYNPLDDQMVRAQAAERVVEREAGSFQIVTMGRDDRIKGHWHLLKAFSLVVKKHPEARLSIIGAGQYLQYKELARALGIEDRVTFTGALKNPFPEVAAADLYVLSSNREGFPNALAEAMALEKPVIATDCRSGPREILLSGKELETLLEQFPYGISTSHVIDGKYGILIPDMSAVINTDAGEIESGEEILAQEICRMMENEALRAHYGRQAYARALTFSMENYKQDLKEILLEGVRRVR